MAGFRPGIVEKLFHQNATRILGLQDAVARAAAAAGSLRSPHAWPRQTW